MEFVSDISPFAGERSRPDFVMSGPRVAVYIDGCFWHGCPQHFTLPKTAGDWWATKVVANHHRDVGASARLASAGWTVVRAWAHEDPTLVAASILHAIAAR